MKKLKYILLSLVLVVLMMPLEAKATSAVYDIGFKIYKYNSSNYENTVLWFEAFQAGNIPSSDEITSTTILNPGDVIMVSPYIKTVGTPNASDFSLYYYYDTEVLEFDNTIGPITQTDMRDTTKGGVFPRNAAAWKTLWQNTGVNVNYPGQIIITLSDNGTPAQDAYAFTGEQAFSFVTFKVKSNAPAGKTFKFEYITEDNLLPGEHLVTIGVQADASYSTVRTIDSISLTTAGAPASNTDTSIKSFSAVGTNSEDISVSTANGGRVYNLSAPNGTTGISFNIEANNASAIVTTNGSNLTVNNNIVSGNYNVSNGTFNVTIQDGGDITIYQINITVASPPTPSTSSYEVGFKIYKYDSDTYENTLAWFEAFQAGSIPASDEITSTTTLNPGDVIMVSPYIKTIGTANASDFSLYYYYDTEVLEFDNTIGPVTQTDMRDTTQGGVFPRNAAAWKTLWQNTGVNVNYPGQIIITLSDNGTPAQDAYAFSGKQAFSFIAFKVKSDAPTGKTFKFDYITPDNLLPGEHLVTIGVQADASYSTLDIINSINLKTAGTPSSNTDTTIKNFSATTNDNTPINYNEDNKVYSLTVNSTISSINFEIEANNSDAIITSFNSNLTVSGSILSGTLPISDAGSYNFSFMVQDGADITIYSVNINKEMASNTNYEVGFIVYKYDKTRFTDTESWLNAFKAGNIPSTDILSEGDVLSPGDVIIASPYIKTIGNAIASDFTLYYYYDSDILEFNTELGPVMQTDERHDRQGGSISI